MIIHNGMATGSMRKGLNKAEVESSRKRYGENRISHKKPKGFFSRLLENFGDPMIKILLIALAINLVFLLRHSDWHETIGIAVAVLVAVVISTLSEQGSELAFKRLQEEAAKIRCRVIRFEGTVELPIEEIVVGDLVSLQAGDRVPADGLLIEGSLTIDQSALNGETKEAKKTATMDAEGELSGNLFDAHQLYSGTVVCAGQGIMCAACIGDQTFYGKLAGEVQEEKGESPLKERLAALAKTISKFGYAGAGLVTFAYLFNAIVLDNGFNIPRILVSLRDPVRMFEMLMQAATLAVTTIVVAIPEGLPMMITVILSSNMKRMLKDNVMIRKLVGIETAGSLNILFTDKTGTLTMGKLQVIGFIDSAGKLWEDAAALCKQPVWKELHKSIRYNTSSDIFKGKAVGGNPTDRALLEYVSLHPVTHKLSRDQVIPFTSENKFMATEISGEVNCTLLKGAPELILPHCKNCMSADGRVSVFTGKQQVSKAMAEMQTQGARLLAIAVSDQPVTTEGRFSNLTLVGIAAVRDDIRREAIEGVKQIQNAGIQVVMITGDAKLTAEAIARQTGLLTGKGLLVLTSDELNRLEDWQVSELLPRLRVVARALPQDKSRLVRIAQSNKLVTGMTGDGVNDAPALKRADIGFAMGSGTEIAKEAGDIVILDDNLLSIAKAIRYGRTIFKSIRKFIIFQLTLNFCAIGVSVIAPMLGIDSPITIIQMLWINMVMDTLGGLAFGGEQALMEYMKEPPKKRDEPIINPYMWREIIFGGLYAVIMCLWFLKSSVSVQIFKAHSEMRYFTAFFALFMFTGIFSSFCARTHHTNLLDHLSGNKPFLIIMGVITLIQIGIIYLGGSVFRTNGLSIHEFILVVLLALTAVIAHLWRKKWYAWKGLPVGT